jgi:phosphoribosylformylglycinamidine cyclo-ligase
VIGDIGGFGGLFALDRRAYTAPVLVSGTDTVGTKALVASMTGRFDTIGIDLVAMCVDDIVCHGAEPLFLLDCVSIGKLVPDHVDALVAGVADGCRQAGCALLGGEMAENPGLFPESEFDLAGFAVGVVERARLLPQRVAPGDVLVGLPSPNLRCNGFSLARRVLLDVGGRRLDDPAYEGAHHSLADELLEPSVIYAPAVAELLRAVDVHALAHITGGGIAGNLARVLPDGAGAVVRRSAWEAPRIFAEIQHLGDVAVEEMARVFNLGIGMIAVVPAGDVHKALDVLRAAGHKAVEIGEVVPGTGAVDVVA